MQFIDLNQQYSRLQTSIDRRLQRVFGHGQYILGAEVNELETQLAQYIGIKHCVTVANGTDALLLALMAIGVQPGDEVITSAFSFFGSASVIALLGAKPVFVDVDPRTYNIKPQFIKSAITARTKAIIAVDLYGQCADYDAINKLAKHHKLMVIEDAAQSFGASYHGRAAGTLADISCTSFFPSKPLGCYGDGGACFTDNHEIATRIQQLRNHGQVSRYQHEHLGLNSRLDTLQAAVLLAKLEVFADEIEKRQMVAATYRKYFAEFELTGIVKIPYIEPYNQSVYAQYTIEVDERDNLQQLLQKQGVPTAVHYPKPLHLQPAFSNHCLIPSPLTAATNAAKKVLSLPFHPYLQAEQIKQVCAIIKRICTNRLVALGSVAVDFADIAHMPESAVAINKSADVGA